MGMRDLVDELSAKRTRIRKMGGEEAVLRQHAAGKLTVRERLDLLFDPGTFAEIGIHATHAGIAPDLAGRETPADGVVAGFGRIDGRLASVIAYDFTVMAGSMGRTAEIKCNRAREVAYTKRVPMIWLIDSAGARIQEAIGSKSFAGSGLLFREESIMSGVVPQVAAMMGPGAAGTAYIPALADFVPMVRGTSNMALGGPPLVKAVVGEDITAEELGGSKVHCEVSGCGDLEVEDDRACIRAVKDYLAYFPANNTERPPGAPCDDPADRREEALLTLVPDSPRRAYDVKKVVRAVVDHGVFFELKPAWAKNVVVGLARLAGAPVGIVANQPMVLGGALDVDAADKAARFIMLCDAFGIPLVFLQDVPGFMVGSKVERAGIIRHGAKMLYAVSEATVPKLTVVLRKAYGAGYFVMCGRGYEPDLIVAWPTAEISVMGPEGGTNIVFRREIAAAADPDAERARRVEEFRKLINPYMAAGAALIDDVIDPRETRGVLIRGLEMARTKTLLRPWKKHGVMPV
ncbi:MAG: propionyl-CoA carboxylase [Candidatus Rokubacteria bacterium RBG_16_73_20]|nr:MAG: propionyl-CoA carboxylase [Candidatus Rokubacteria bacterium GWA2_73_35]OGK89490.1 MAG: propionyl-CoA carboxylase [Candidatus Rokubacteria bacterium RBG_16_73_20]